MLLELLAGAILGKLLDSSEESKSEDTRDTCCGYSSGTDDDRYEIDENGNVNSRGRDAGPSGHGFYGSGGR